MESRIVIDPRIHHGKPATIGTRVPVDLVLSKLRNGIPQEAIARKYAITDEDINAVLAYTATCRENT